MSNGTSMFYFFSRTFLRRSPVDIIMATVSVAVVTNLTVLTCTTTILSFTNVATCMYERMYACLYVCLGLRMHVLTYIYVHTYVGTVHIFYSRNG